MSSTSLLKHFHLFGGGGGGGGGAGGGGGQKDHHHNWNIIPHGMQVMAHTEKKIPHTGDTESLDWCR